MICWGRESLGSRVVVGGRSHNGCGGRHHVGIVLDRCDGRCCCHGRLAHIPALQSRQSRNVGMQSRSQVRVRVLNVILESVQVLVAFTTLEECTPVRLGVHLVLLCRAWRGTMTVLIVVLESIRVLVGLVTSLDQTTVGLVCTRRSWFANALHDAHNLFTFPDQFLGRLDILR